MNDEYINPEKCLTNLESNQLSRYISISEEINDNNFH